MGAGLIRVAKGSISAGIAVLAVGLAIKWDVIPAGAGSRVEDARPESFDVRHPVGARIPAGPHVRLASLEMEVDGAAESEAVESDPAASTTPRMSFGERFSGAFDGPSGEDYDSSVVFGGPVLPTPLTRSLRAPPPGSFASPDRLRAARVPPPDVAKQETARAAAPGAAAVAEPSPPAASAKPARTADLGDDPVSPPAPAPGNRTAIYDISAKVVYLPSGEKLEAHSGLGSNLDNPRSISARHRGVTPPNVYDLTLRKELFHGVQAIRLVPTDGSRMFGRAGMLAHSYMLGPSGQSNGCVSFSNYPAFLNAFLKGEVDRLVVVEHLDDAPSTGTGLGWVPESIRNLFKTFMTAGPRSSST
jgi:hypothetical protein